MSDYTPDQLRRIDGLIEQHVFGRAVEWQKNGVAYSPVHSTPMLVPNYTVAGTWAWEVLEWLVQRIEYVGFNEANGVWYVESEDADTKGATLQLAICLHALQVAGVDAEKEVTE